MICFSCISIALLVPMLDCCSAIAQAPAQERSLFHTAISLLDNTSSLLSAATTHRRKRRRSSFPLCVSAPAAPARLQVVLEVRCTLLVRALLPTKPSRSIGDLVPVPSR